MGSHKRNAAAQASNASRQPLSELAVNVPAQQKQSTIQDLFARQRATVSDAACSSSSPYSGGLDSTFTNYSNDTDSSDEDEDERPALKRRRLHERMVSTDNSPVQRAKPIARRLKKTLMPGDRISPCDLLTRLSLAPSHQHNKLSLRNVDHSEYLSSFVSHRINDVYRLEALTPGRAYTAPFVCQFSHEAKRGGKQLLAVSSEEGTVSLMDVGIPFEEERASRTMLQPHQNAVFDARFSADDQRIATASGDQAVCISDVRTGQTLYRATGHTGSIKQLRWNDRSPDQIASCARDGTIRIWDLRLAAVVIEGGGSLLVLNINKKTLLTFRAAYLPETNLRYSDDTIRNAHGKKSRRSTEARTAIRSVTALAYAGHREHHIFSAGSYSGEIKLWDLRRTFQKRINPPALAVSPDFAVGLSDSKRSHGIADIVLSPDSSQLYALSTASQIYCLDAHDISRPEPIKVFKTGTIIRSNYTLADFSANSFYLKLALSSRQNGRFLASGSRGGSIWLFDTERPDAQPVSIRGHVGEVVGVDFGYDALASCSDDTMVRLWRPKLDVARVERHRSWTSTWEGAW